jgi:hypothetical protein
MDDTVVKSIDNMTVSDNETCESVQNVQEIMDESMKLDKIDKIDKLDKIDYRDKKAVEFEIFHNNLDVYNIRSNERVICLGVPNVLCKKYFDDEDFVYSTIDLPKHIKKYIQEDQPVSQYAIQYLLNNQIMLNYLDLTPNSNQLYGKVIYMYQYVHLYYSSLKTMRPVDRMTYMPSELFQYVDNIVNILKIMLSNNMFSQKEIIYVDPEYFNELLYGLNHIICHIKMILNHYRLCKISLESMQYRHVKKLFKLLNNMSVIIIFIKLVCNGM